MKRRAVSFITSLALCLGLCSTWALAATSQKITIKKDTPNGTAYTIMYPTDFDGGGFTYTVPGGTAMSVQSGGSLTIKNGTIVSGKGAGVEVKSGGSLTVSDPNVTVTGTSSGLNISSGATVQLSGGTFTASSTAGKAIQTEDGKYDALLVTGYAFFDESGEPIPLTDVGAKNTVSVQKCTDHVYDVYTPTGGAPTHDWTCLACGTKGTTPCSFSFDEDGKGTCADCSHTLEITIVPNSAAYDGALKPDTDPVTVMLDGTTRLTKGDHYTVDYTARADVGKVVITVDGDGKIYTGDWTYTAEFSVTKAQPVITWNTDSVTVNYNGEPVDRAVILQEVSITPTHAESLKDILQFSYREYKEGEEGSDAGFTDGLPTDAGTYEIKASLPEQKNYEAAVTECLKLTIKKINPIIETPEAIKLVYNRTAQELVTPGAVRNGAKILFATSKGGTYSETIPTGTNADTDYEVWYKVEGTNNYIAVTETKIENVTIQRKPVTPDVKLQYTSTVYDGGKKEPTVTVTDTTDNNYVLPTTEYTVTYTNNKNVGTATVTVTDSGSGNYIVSEVKCTFQITAADQNTLTITDQPDVVCYGDTFTLGTVGGSGSGTVTWKIISATDAESKPIENGADFIKVAEIGKDSGQVTVKGLGSFTVQATKAGETNHEDTIAKATFRVDPKRVVAVVTAANKTYDGDVDADVTAEVPKQDIVPGDTITITMPNGTFSDANAGTNKSVTVNINGAIIVGDVDGQGYKKYTVIIPTTPVRADITRAATSITVKTEDDDGAELKLENSRDYDGTPQALLFDNVLSASTETNVEVTIEYALSESGPYSTVIPQATDAGGYEVWYRVKETGNYFGTAAKSVTVIISPKQVTADVTLENDSYVYDGKAKEPTVTVTYNEGDEKKEIPSTEYTVTYKNNVNVGDKDGTNPPTVIVTAKAGGNYAFDEQTALFSITKGDKATLTGSPLPKDLTYTGEPQDLVTVGTASGGKVVYALAKTNDKPAEEADGAPTEEEAGDEPADGAYSTTIPQGKAAGLYKVYYKVEGDDNHEDTDPAYVFVTISPKTVVSPAIQFEVKKEDPQENQEEAEYSDTYSVEYNGDPKTPSVIVKDGDEIIPDSEYTVTYSNNTNAGTATVHITDKSGGNYIVNGSKTFTIEKATASFATEPQSAVPEGETALTYSGKAQTLIKAGVANGGTAVYTLDDPNGPYSPVLPTGTDRGTYTVYAKVRGDANHEDSAVKEIEVTIGVNTVTIPKVELSPTSFQYNGNEQKPTITVKDEKGNVIPENEYDVTYERVMDDDAEATEPEPTEPGPVKIIDAGTYKITIKSKPGGNYSFETDCTFTITPANQAALTITGKPTVVCYGDKFMLSAVGGLGDGEITWSTGNQGIASINPSSGLVEVTGVGTVTITATKAASTDGNYEAATATWIVTTLKAATAVATPPIAKTGLVYDTTEQELLDFGGTTVKGIGTVKYCLSADGTYSAAIPKERNAGTYKVWYKVEDDTNWTGTAPAYVEVTIARKEVKADDLTVKWDNNAEEVEGVKIVVTYVDDDGTTKMIARSEYTAKVNTSDWEEREWITVEVTAKEKGNYKFNLSALIEHTPSGGEYNDSDDLDDPGIGGGDGPSIGDPVRPGDGPGIEETASPQTTVRDGTASTVVSDAAGRQLVNEAVANGSENVVIKPEITGDVTKTEVSIPASAVSRLSSETDAALTVSTPVADVTIPNKSLETLSGAGGTVSVVTEQVDNTVVLTLTVDGKDVGNIPGGLTLTVSVEDIVPGTVAVLVYEDGTRETVRRSVAEDGGVRIPLNGSATVEIVDNSKEFADVPAESWAADAVAFTSAHELFNGTGEATFSPGLSMNRAMLATVLYNLEGCPDQELTEDFSDVSSSAWYAASVSWAAANGVVGGYGDGQFGPDTDITREQIAVMLWRYAGSPATDEQSLNFTDAGQASSYALEALYWAAANGIMNGHGDGRLDPGGLATRAQTAQMLKNFMENT